MHLTHISMSLSLKCVGVTPVLSPAPATPPLDPTHLSQSPCRSPDCLHLSLSPLFKLLTPFTPWSGLVVCVDLYFSSLVKLWTIISPGSLLVLRTPTVSLVPVLSLTLNLFLLDLLSIVYFEP